MPTKREREYYRMGFMDGQRVGLGETPYWFPSGEVPPWVAGDDSGVISPRKRAKGFTAKGMRKRKLSAWNKYVKNKRNHITYRDGKLNLKKMAVAFRRKKRK
jgi:hypothetical protein